jgi:stearoyl-CoA desaturase (delta-9 desaturase)
MDWMLHPDPQFRDRVLLHKFAPDLARHRLYIWLEKFTWVPITVWGLLCLYFGGFQAVLWGVFLPTVVGWHATWLVNSATHMWGSQRYSTGDDSRNNWWVAILTAGEGWHNNHHRHPVSARHGLAWYEIDETWYLIKILKAVGLIWDVKTAKL